MDSTAGEDQGSESDVPPALDTSVEQEKFHVDVLAELRELRERFDSKIRYDEVKERQIDALHEELQGHRQGLYQQIMRVIGNSPARAFADLHLIVSKVLISARRA